MKYLPFAAFTKYPQEKLKKEKHMEKIKVGNKWKRLALCLAVAMAVLTASKAAPAYAGDFTAAATLPTNGMWSGMCGLVEGTTDYYKFTIPAAGAIDIKLMAYTEQVNAVLYDANFNKIEHTFAYGSEQSPGTSVIYQWLSQGTYYVSVSLSYAESGNYKLYASFLSSGITAADKDSFDLPQAMRVNSRVSGVMTYSNRADWYKVPVPAAGIYRQALQHNDNMEVRLYDGNLTEIKALKSDNSPTMAASDVELKPGIYYIKITGYVSSSCGTYTYQLNEVIPAKGDILTDAKKQAQYKVTKAGRSGGTVTYQKSMNGVKTSVTVPATVKVDGITYKVTGIAADAFRDNRMLKKVTIGKNVTSIGKRSFRGCSSLRTLSIGADVASLGDYAFQGCTSLKSVTVPAKVSKIGKQAFYGCKKLKTIKINTKKLNSKNVGNKAFAKIDPKATVKVPSSCLKAYKKILQKKGINGKSQKIKS